VSGLGIGEENKRNKGERLTTREGQRRRGRTERMEEEKEEEKEKDGRTGSGDWKMTIWCTRMAVFLFLEN